MSDKGTVFQKGGGGTNFEQHVQAAFVATMAVKGNAPGIPQNTIDKVVFQSTNRGWETDDILIIAKSDLSTHQLLVQAKYTLVFSEDNQIFKEVIYAFWKDFNKSNFSKSNDRLVIVKNSLNNIEKNHIKGILNYAKTHSSPSDFIDEVDRIKEKKSRLTVFKNILSEANGGVNVTDSELWSFLKCVDLHGYDFLDIDSTDKTYFLNLIKLSKRPDSLLGEKDIWNSIIEFVGKANPAGGSLSRDSIKETEFYSHLDLGRLDVCYKSVGKLEQDGQFVLDPIKNTVGVDHTLHIRRPEMLNGLLSAMTEFDFCIVSGKPGVGKSAAVKSVLKSSFNDSYLAVFKADILNQSHLSAVFSSIGINETLIDMFSCISLNNDRVIFIDSLEKVLEDDGSTGAFKQLVLIAQKNKIKIVATCRRYAIDLIIQKFDLEAGKIKVFEVPQLSDGELREVTSIFPKIAPAIKNEKIRSLLQIVKYLDLTLKSLRQLGDNFAELSVSQYKDTLWQSVIANSTFRERGLSAKREFAFINVAVRRAKEMRLFTRPVECDEEALDLLESDDVIFQDGNSRRYAPTHDILEDWALIKYVQNKYLDSVNVKTFFEEIGNEPAIRRAVRLWAEEVNFDRLEEATALLKWCISDSSEKYWAEEVLTAVFKSEDSNWFFEKFERELLKDGALLLNRCLSLIKVSCRATDYGMTERPLLVIGSGWGASIRFVANHLSTLNHLRDSILSFIDQWEYKLIFQYSETSEELVAVRKICLHYINQIQNGDGYWSEWSSHKYLKLLQTVLIGLVNVASKDIEKLVGEALGTGNQRKSSRRSNFQENFVSYFLGGVRTQRVIEALPDLVIEASWRRWKYVPVKLDRNSSTSDLLTFQSPWPNSKHCWGITESRDFSPSGIYKTFATSLLQHHPAKGLKFIVEFVNYSIDFYKEAKCQHKHELTDIVLTLNNGTVLKQTGSFELWVAYRGLSVTHYLLECLLMFLEHFLLDVAKEGTGTSRASLAKMFPYILEKSNSVMTTAVLSSVAMAYPNEIGEEMLPLVSIKEIYEWDIKRVINERSAMAPDDQSISFAQQARWEFNKLPHRIKFTQGFKSFIIDHQLNIRSLNISFATRFDRLWSDASPDDIIWMKTLNEIDVRRWTMTEVDKLTNSFTVGPKYVAEVQEYVDSHKSESASHDIAAIYSSKISKVFKGVEQIDLETWKSYLTYYINLSEPHPLHDSPIKFVAISLRDFGQHLSEEALGWCHRTWAYAIGSILKSNNNFSAAIPNRIFERDEALDLFDLIYKTLIEDEDKEEAITMLTYALVSLSSLEIKTLVKHFRDKFSKSHPIAAKNIWLAILHISRFRKENQFFIRDPYFGQQEIKDDKELQFIENIGRNQDDLLINISAIDYVHFDINILTNALLSIPFNTDDSSHIQFVHVFVDIIKSDFEVEEDSMSYPGKMRQIDHRQLLDIEIYFANFLYNISEDNAKALLDLFFSRVYETEKAKVIKRDFLNFVSSLLDQIIYIVNDMCTESNDFGSVDKHIERFWRLWRHITNLVIQKNIKYFNATLLLKTEYRWNLDLEDSKFLKGRIEDYKLLQESFGESNLRAVLAVLSTVGRKELLPSGLLWITDVLEKNPAELNNLDITACERLCKYLFTNHGSVLKKNQDLTNNFIWFLDRLIEIGSSSAYSLRENVMTYKVYL